MSEELKNEAKIEEEKPVVSVSALQDEISKLRGENEKLKNQYNKVSTEAADWRKKLKEKMDDDEKKSFEASEAATQLQNELKALKEQVAVQKATERYMSLGMDKELAHETAAYEFGGEMEKVTANVQTLMESRMKNAQTEWLASRKDVNTSHEESTAEEDPFMKGFTGKK